MGSNQRYCASGVVGMTMVRKWCLSLHISTRIYETGPGSPGLTAGTGPDDGDGDDKEDGMI